MLSTALHERILTRTADGTYKCVCGSSISRSSNSFIARHFATKRHSMHPRTRERNRPFLVHLPQDIFIYVMRFVGAFNDLRRYRSVCTAFRQRITSVCITHIERDWIISELDKFGVVTRIIQATRKWLKILCCDKDGSITLPNDFPVLEILSCSYCNFSTLPSYLPALRVLYCQFNALKTLPELPEVRTLVCGFNSLTHLPSNLSNVHYLRCESNSLKELPALPRAHSIWCQRNYLTHLPVLPMANTISCSFNRMFSIGLPAPEDMPSLKWLICNNVPNEESEYVHIDYIRLDSWGDDYIRWGGWGDNWKDADTPPSDCVDCLHNRFDSWMS